MSYVIAGYAITFVGLAGYSFRTVARGRALARALAPRRGDTK